MQKPLREIRNYLGTLGRLYGAPCEDCVGNMLEDPALLWSSNLKWNPTSAF